jgi:hypothetical protein
MSLRKKSLKCSPTHFLSKQVTFAMEKWAASLIFKKAAQSKPDGTFSCQKSQFG